MIAAQFMGIMTSVFSVAFSIPLYLRVKRFSTPNKANMDIRNMRDLFIWHNCTLVARFTSMLAFARGTSPFGLAGGLLIHWLAMTIWILKQQVTQRSGQKRPYWGEVLISMAIACVYNFDFLNLREGHTRLRYCVFYHIFYGENFLLILASYSETKFMLLHLFYFLIFMIVGICAQVNYFLRYHPNRFTRNRRPIQCCLTYSELCNKTPPGAATISTELQNLPPDSNN